MDNVQIYLYDSKDGSFLSSFESNRFPNYKRGEVLITKSTVMHGPVFRKDQAELLVRTYRIREITHGIQDVLDEPFSHILYLSVDVLSSKNIDPNSIVSEEYTHYPSV